MGSCRCGPFAGRYAIKAGMSIPCNKMTLIHIIFIQVARSGYVLHYYSSFNIELLPVALFGRRRAVIFAAVLWSPSSLANNLAGCGPDLHYLTSFTSSILLRGFVRTPGVHGVLPAVATVASDNALIHIYSFLPPFSRGGAACLLLLYIIQMRLALPSPGL